MCQECFDLIKDPSVDEDEPSVVCIDPDADALTVGKRYDVLNRDWDYEDGSTYYRVVNDLGHIDWYHEENFKKG